MSGFSSKIEAILYLKGQPLSLQVIAELAGCDRQVAQESLNALQTSYDERSSALEIAQSNQGYCLQLRAEYQTLVHTLVPLDLGKGALRTLAAIALVGPINQTDLVDLRGSGVYQHVPQLVELGLIRKTRQRQGRSYRLQLTEKFHQYFQIEQLPSLADLVKQKTDRPEDESAAPVAQTEEASPLETELQTRSEILQAQHPDETDQP